jgi:hypothetical protein
MVRATNQITSKGTETCRLKNRYKKGTRAPCDNYATCYEMLRNMRQKCSQFKQVFLNLILFAICTSTFSKLCKNMYTVACGRVLSSAPL